MDDVCLVQISETQREKKTLGSLVISPNSRKDHHSVPKFRYHRFQWNEAREMFTKHIVTSMVVLSHEQGILAKSLIEKSGTWCVTAEKSHKDH